MANIKANDKYAPLAGPYHWNDADMLQCGQPHMSLAECRLSLSLWSLAKSPLLIGADVRKFNSSVIKLLGNPEVIAVNQDALGQQGRLVSSVNASQVWAGALTGGRFVAALVNLDAASIQPVTLSWAMLGQVRPSMSFTVRDLWARR